VTETLGSSGLIRVLCGFALCVSSVVFAETEDEEVPDMDFLEYLGMWEETDEDWQRLDEDTVAENDERSDPVPESKESTENEDES
jgi:hypothetical protein